MSSRQTFKRDVNDPQGKKQKSKWEPRHMSIILVSALHRSVLYRCSSVQFYLKMGILHVF